MTKTSILRRWLIRIGNVIFGVRLFVGLVIAGIGIEMLKPKPFFGDGQRGVQILGLLLIAAGVGFRAWATGCAGRHTRSKEIDAPLLVTFGPFSYLRNPIYAGTICLGIGMVLLIGDFLGLILAGVAFLILYLAIVPAEEAFLSQQFGEEYERYKAAVPRFFPRLTPWDGRVKRPFHWRALRGEVGIAFLLALIYLALWFEEYLDKLWG